MSTADVRLVPARRLIVAPVDALFALAPGDRALVAPGDSVVVGAPIAERIRDPRLDEVDLPEAAAMPRPGARWTGSSRRGADEGPTGEHVFEWHGRWRVATGDITDAARDAVRRASSATSGRGPGSRSGPPAGASAASSRSADRPAAGSSSAPTASCARAVSTSGSAGTILVVGSRVDAETLTRARAMGVCGVVVAGLSSKERRDFLASEARQRAALHRLPPFAVLVLDGATRRPLAGAVQAVLAALAGSEVAIVTDPPMLVFDRPNLVIPPPPVDLVRIRRRRDVRAARASSSRPSVRAGSRAVSTSRPASSGCPDGTDAAVPLGDLERFV